MDAVGPVDPEIGLLRIDRIDGTPLALVYNFACHPIHGVPAAATRPIFLPLASERRLKKSAVLFTAGKNVTAFFIQGAGDINPAMYKVVNQVRDTEHYGNQLGLSTLHAARQIQPQETSTLTVINEIIALPRGAVWKVEWKPFRLSKQRSWSRFEARTSV